MKRKLDRGLRGNDVGFLDTSFHQNEIQNSYAYRTPILNLVLSLLCLIMLFQKQTFAQTQTIRGQILEKETNSSLPSASVILYKDAELFKSVRSDLNGNFRMDNIPVGKYLLKITFIGYGDYSLPNLIVNSGKEVILEIKLEEKVEMVSEAVVVARKKGMVTNEMATVSTRTFSVEETERYAGSRQDPARMVSNFAGIQGTDDSRNDVVIRGNSPIGLLYRFEGVDIPNPNHFSIPGAAGGPVSILDNKTIATSDFYTGAFPAEYGNSMAGVFDLRMRNGNNQKYENTFQFGILGTELCSEGPISKAKGSSYLVTGRYSTLKMLQGLKINFGTSAVPTYADGSVKFNFPLNEKNNLSIFGMSGYSTIAIILSTKKDTARDLYAVLDRDQTFTSELAVAGATLKTILSPSAYSSLTIAQSFTSSIAHHELFTKDSLLNLTSIYPVLRYTFSQGKTSVNYFVNKKFSKKSTLKFGINNDMFENHFVDSAILYGDTSKTWKNRWDYKGNTFLLQPFFTFRYRLNDKLSITSGVHGQYLTLNGSKSLEPRLGLKYNLSPTSSVSFGMGLHSQMQPSYTYFYHLAGTEKKDMHNLNMGFSRSLHNVLGYDVMLGSNARIKAEVYYQSLFGIPVSDTPSSYSMANIGGLFERTFPGKLVNEGTGENYGAEFTLERFYSDKYFFMITGSVFNSTYTGSDGKKRNTDFNGGYAVNFLGSREFRIGNNTITIGGKITQAGGRRYSPVDTMATRLAGEKQIVDNARNTLQFKPYFRSDIKLGYKLNAKRVTHEVAIDIVNVFNTKNILSLTWLPYPVNAYREEYQLGLLPLFYYKVDF